VSGRGAGAIAVLPVEGLPEVAEGAGLGRLVAERVRLCEGDVVVVSQKVVSKAEGRVVHLASVEPRPEARRLAAELDKDPAMVEVILGEAQELIRAERGVLIAKTRHGFVCANAGVDSSNLPEAGSVSLLPEDPDESARRIRDELTEATGVGPLATLVTDSFGRAWRLGQAEVAIGCAGLAPLDDWRGRDDAEGRELSATLIAIADEIAAAADLVRDKASRVPIAVVRGLARHVSAEDGPGAAGLRRPAGEDLFR
jgi:coenzyme F420-0:L-glutamate ligase / coenzyme F420-1:gamma-L-glutamate ligase